MAKPLEFGDEEGEALREGSDLAQARLAVGSSEGCAAAVGEPAHEARGRAGHAREVVGDRRRRAPRPPRSRCERALGGQERAPALVLGALRCHEVAHEAAHGVGGEPVPPRRLAEGRLEAFGRRGDLDGDGGAKGAALHLSLEGEREALEELEAPADPVPRAPEHPREAGGGVALLDEVAEQAGLLDGVHLAARRVHAQAMAAGGALVEVQDARPDRLPAEAARGLEADEPIDHLVADGRWPEGDGVVEPRGRDALGEGAEEGGVLEDL
jgi:hypothetical protein